MTRLTDSACWLFTNQIMVLRGASSSFCDTYLQLRCQSETEDTDEMCYCKPLGVGRLLGGPSACPMREALKARKLRTSSSLHESEVSLENIQAHPCFSTISSQKQCYRMHYDAILPRFRAVSYSQVIACTTEQVNYMLYRITWAKCTAKHVVTSVRYASRPKPI